MYLRKRGHKKEDPSAGAAGVGPTGTAVAPAASKPVAPSFDDDAERLLIGHYQLMKTIGRGAFGIVYRGLCLNTAETVAVKRINLQGVPRDELDAIEQEIGLLQGLMHPNIVKYRDAIRSDSHLNIVLEFVENGSLLSMMAGLGGKFPEPLVVLYTAQVVVGLEYLHNQGVIHRDIKSANILSTKHGLVKLADFGVATKLNESRKSTSVVGTPYWMAPEIIEMTGQQSPACDIWSVGCTVIELLTGKPPYFELQQMPALFRIVQDDHPPLPDNITPVCKSFLLECFQKDPNRRIDAQGLLKHPWLKDTVKQFKERLRTGALSMIESSTAPHLAESPATPVRTAGAAAAAVLKGPGSAAKAAATAGADDDDINWDDDDDVAPSSAALPPAQGVHGSSAAARSAALSPSARAAAAGAAADDVIDELPDEDALYLPSAPLGPAASNKASGVGAGAGKTKAGGATPNTGARALAMYREKDEEDEWDIDADALAAKLDVGGHQRKPSGRSVGAAAAPKQSAAAAAASKAPASAAATGAAPAGKTDISAFMDDDDDGDGFGDLASQLVSAPALTLDLAPAKPKPSGGVSSSSGGGDDDDDDDGFGDLDFNAPRTRGSDMSMSDDDEEEDDPFDNVDFIDAGADINTATLTKFDKLISLLAPAADDAAIVETCRALSGMVIGDAAVVQTAVTRCVVPIMEMLESPSMTAVHATLCLVNNIVSQKIFSSFAVNVALAGLIPVCAKFSSRSYPDEIRLEAAVFVRHFCQSSDAAPKMFVSCGGVPALVDFFRDDDRMSKELACCAIDCIEIIFNINSSPRNDFCRLFCKAGLLPLLAEMLLAVHTETLMAQVGDAALLRYEEEGKAAADAAAAAAAGATEGVPTPATDAAADKKGPTGAKVNGGAIATAAAKSAAAAAAAAAGSTETKSDTGSTAGTGDAAASATSDDTATAGAGTDSGSSHSLTRAILTSIASAGRSRLGRDLSELLPRYVSVREYVVKVATVLDWFASGDAVVKSHFRERAVIRVLISVLPTLPQEAVIVVLKSLRAIVMDTTAMDMLEECGAIPTLIPFLDSKHLENQTQVLMDMYYLCSLKPTRQEQAVVHGIIPHLQRFIRTKHPLNQFAYPVMFALCKLSKFSRAQLRKHDGVEFYLDILCDPYWRTQALECIATWLADDFERVEFVLAAPSNVGKILGTFRTTHNATQFEAMLPAFLRLLTASAKLNHALGSLLLPDIYARLRKHSTNNTIRINLLRVLRQVVAAKSANVRAALARTDVRPLLGQLAKDTTYPIVSSLAQKVMEELDGVDAPAVAAH